MKLLREMTHIIFWSWAIVVVAFLRLSNPELTETQLFVEFWQWWAMILLLVVLYGVILRKTEVKVGEDV